ncbi:MAG TPA: hypothetical protein VEV62_10635 [Parafilimonas sp.]|nr:hypothetical protein [Parafilimonas sp.]
MKTITKLGSVIAFFAIIASTSCSVEYRSRHRRHRVIEVGINEQNTQKIQVIDQSSGQKTNRETPVAVK